MYHSPTLLPNRQLGVREVTLRTYNQCVYRGLVRLSDGMPAVMINDRPLILRLVTTMATRGKNNP